MQGHCPEGEHRVALVCAGDITQQQGGESLGRELLRATALGGLFELLCLSHGLLAPSGEVSGVCQGGRLSRVKLCVFGLYLKHLECESLNLAPVHSGLRFLACCAQPRGYFGLLLWDHL